MFAAFIIRQTSEPMRIPGKVLYLGMFFILSGLVLYFIYFAKLEQARVRCSWPITAGVVDTSKVAGKRAFRPIITYGYFVNGKAYQDSTDLDVPGFGGRMNRLDAAETLAKQYHKGKELAVYYNPENPHESLLRAGPSYTDYLAISLGALLAMTGLVLYLLHYFPRKPK